MDQTISKCEDSTGITMINYVIIVLVSFSMGVQAACPEFQSGQVSGTVQTDQLTEASGLAASRRNPGVFWAHNDSGDTARIFALTPEGNHLGIYNLQGATANDWEDMAVGPGPLAGVSYLYIGDIGDNAASRSSIKVFRVPEPAVDLQQSPVTVSLTNWESFNLQYSDGSRNAESLFIDPANGDLYIITKEQPASKLYRVQAPLNSGSTNILAHLLTLSFDLATGADISVDGYEILVRRYPEATLWQRPPGGEIQEAFQNPACSIPAASEVQGEAIAFDALGSSYYTLSEGQFQPIYRYNRTLSGIPDGIWITY